MNITELLQTAKDNLLKEGQQTPTLFVEFRDQTGLTLRLSGFPEGLLKQRELMFVAGRQAGKVRREQDIAQLCFFVEMWISEQVGNSMPASQASDRKEVLALQILDVVAPEAEDGKPGVSQTMHVIELIRDGSGKLVDLLPYDEPMELCNSTLESFFAGFMSAKIPEEDFQEMVAWAAKQALKCVKKEAKKAKKRAKKAGKKQ